jgi:hypothetical protein
MIERENASPNSDSHCFMKSSSEQEGQQPIPLISREDLVRRLQRGVQARAKFVESHLNKTLAFQIRSLRGDWTQSEFAEKLGMKHPNNVSARLENPNYGKHTLTTLKRIAAARDVGLVVWFVPFSRLIDWANATPYLDTGLSPDFYNIPSFTEEFAQVVPPPTWGSFPQDQDANSKQRQPKGARAGDEDISTRKFLPLPELGSIDQLGQAG